MPISRNLPFVLDTDTDPNKLPANNARALVNIFLEQQYATGCFGNRLIPYAGDTLGSVGGDVEGGPPAGPAEAHRCVAACWDAEAQVAYYLLYADTGTHRIMRYLPAGNGGAELVLRWQGLNLPARSGVAQPCITDGKLLYLDAAGEVRCIPVARALGGFYTPALLAAEPYCLHLIRPAPGTPLITRLDTLPTGQLGAVLGSVWQFAVTDRYLDGEQTVPGHYSELVDLSNAATDEATKGLRVALPGPVSALVQERVLWARRDAETDWLAVATVPAGTTSFDFYGTRTGEALPASVAARTHESLWPAAALALARNRVFVGALREGYPVPPSALTARVVNRADANAGGAGADVVTVTKTVLAYDRLIQVYNQANDTYDDTILPVQVVSFYAYTSAAPGQYYAAQEVGAAGAFIVPAGTAPSGPSVLTDTTPQQPDEMAGSRTFTVSVVAGATVTGLPAAAGGGVTSAVERTLHERCDYEVAVQFYDALGRPGTATTPLVLTVPAQDYTRPQARVAEWSLPATATIPAWAHYYCILLSRNRTATTFVQGCSTTVVAYRGEDSSNEPILEPQTTAHDALWVDIGTWPREGQGYIWTAGSGDRLRFQGETQSYPITGQRGRWVAIETRGQATTTTGVVEIFTPRSGDGAAHLVFERSPRYRILGAETAARRFEVSQGILEGDAFLLGHDYTPGGQMPNSTIVEGISANRGRIGVWLDASRGGRPAAVVPAALQQTYQPNAIRFSNVRVAGTLSNGLSEWEPASIEDSRIPREIGPLRALAVADDTQAQGTILLALAEHGAASIGLSTAQIRQANGVPLTADTDAVIGYVNTLHGGYGTQDPATVTAHAGQVYFFDRQRRAWLRYAQNGVTSLGEQFNFRARCVAAADTPLIGAGYDWQREEAVLLTSTAALVMDERHKRCADTRTIPAEQALGTPFGLLTWQNGQLWRHDALAPACSFFGTYAPPRIETVFCDNANYAKRPKAVAVESPALWLPTTVTTDTGGLSTMRPAFFEQREGVWRGALRRNQNSPGFASPDVALYEGQPLDGTRFHVTLTAPAGQERQPLSAVSLSWEPRQGASMGIS